MVIDKCVSVFFSRFCTEICVCDIYVALPNSKKILEEQHIYKKCLSPAGYKSHDSFYDSISFRKKRYVKYSQTTKSGIFNF